MKKAIGIVRVSKEDGRKGESFSSPKDQCDDMRRLAAEQGWQLTIPEPHEINISGNSQLADRPQLSRAVMAVQTGQADAIVGATTERLWWNQEVRAQVLRLVIEAEGEVWSCDEGLLTTESAAEEFSGTVRLAADRFRRRQDAEKARKAQVRAVARGVVPWSDVTFGYRLIEEGERKGSWESVPEQAAIVQRAFQMRAEGGTIKEVRAWLARQGVTAKPRTCREHKHIEPMEDCRACCADAKPISYHGVQTLLRSRTLLGEIRFGQLTNLEAFEPIVERDLFERVQRRILVREPRAPSQRILARLSVLRCGTCGSAMVVGSAHHSQYALYRCPPTGDCPRRVTIAAPMVERAVVEAVKKDLADEVGRASAAAHIRAAADAVDQARENYRAAFQAFSDFTDEITRARLLQLKKQWDEAQEQLDQLGGPDAAAKLQPALHWDWLSVEAKRDLIRATVKGVRITPAGAQPGGRITIAMVSGEILVQ